MIRGNFKGPFIGQACSLWCAMEAATDPNNPASDVEVVRVQAHRQMKLIRRKIYHFLSDNREMGFRADRLAKEAETDEHNELFVHVLYQMINDGVVKHSYTCRGVYEIA
jgi:hypothetical protein